MRSRKGGESVRLRWWWTFEGRHVEVSGCVMSRCVVRFEVGYKYRLEESLI